MNRDEGTYLLIHPFDPLLKYIPGRNWNLPVTQQYPVIKFPAPEVDQYHRYHSFEKVDVHVLLIMSWSTAHISKFSTQFQFWDWGFQKCKNQTFDQFEDYLSKLRNLKQAFFTQTRISRFAAFANTATQSVVVIRAPLALFDNGSGLGGL